MRARAAGLALLALALLLAGCLGAPQAVDGPNPGNAPPTRRAFDAPWWSLGDAYTLRIERAGQPAASYRLVNFWNDTATAHFWLGVADRQQAMEHALFDTNPFLGRIHHGILTPHERGMHAAMYSFPLEDGRAWSGFLFGKNWSFTVREAAVATPLGPDRGVRVEGASTDGDGVAIKYDYSPKLRWFANLEETDRNGAMRMRATVEQYERGVHGSYVFLRGRDFYQGPRVGGTHDESFRVDEDVGSIAFYVKARAAGPLEVQILDPAGTIRHRAIQPTGGEASTFQEIGPVPRGEWKVRYVTTGGVDGRVLATGLIETKGTV